MSTEQCKYVSYGKVKKIYDVTPQTLKNWAKNDLIDYKVIKNLKKSTWLYNIDSIGKRFEYTIEKKEIVYSSVDEYILLKKTDQEYEKYECISNINDVLDLLTSSIISKIILYKKCENYEILYKLCEKFNCEIEIYNKEDIYIS